MSKEEIHDLLAYDGLKIIQRKDLFRFSLDSLLLANFTKINLRAKKILDFGTGLGPIPLYLSLKTKKPIIGIDIQKDAVELAKKSVELNQLQSQITIEHLDILLAYKTYVSSSFDVITCNPPFFKYHDEALLNDLDSMTLARHEVKINLEGVISSAKKLLSTGGSFNLIHRAARIEEIIQTLSAYGFVIKRMRFVYTKPAKKAMMVLIDARLNGETGNIAIEEPLYIYDNNNEYTEEVLEIFHLGDACYVKKS